MVLAPLFPCSRSITSYDVALTGVASQHSRQQLVLPSIKPSFSARLTADQRVSLLQAAGFLRPFTQHPYRRQLGSGRAREDPSSTTAPRLRAGLTAASV